MIVSADGDGGMYAGRCPNRKESPSLSDKSKSLVLVNYFKTFPMEELMCIDNSGELINRLHTCYGATGNRWANFVTFNYYKACASFYLNPWPKSYVYIYTYRKVKERIIRSCGHTQ